MNEDSKYRIMTLADQLKRGSVLRGLTMEDQSRVMRKTADALNKIARGDCDDEQERRYVMKVEDFLDEKEKEACGGDDD